MSGKPVTREWLHEKYIVAGLTTVDVAAIVHRNPKRVWEWLREFNIPTRPRGSYSRVNNTGRKYPGRKLSDAHKEAIRAARKRDGRVPYLKDGKAWMAGRVGAAHHNWRGGLTPARQAFYVTAEWKSACRAVWARASATCERCALKFNRASGVPFNIHHVQSFAVEATRAVVSNLVLLCEPCHRFVHSRRNRGREFLQEGAA